MIGDVQAVFIKDTQIYKGMRFFKQIFKYTLEFFRIAQFFEGVGIEDKIQIGFSFLQKRSDHLLMVINNSLHAGDGIVLQ